MVLGRQLIWLSQTFFVALDPPRAFDWRRVIRAANLFDGDAGERGARIAGLHVCRRVAENRADFSKKELAQNANGQKVRAVMTSSVVPKALSQATAWAERCHIIRKLWLFDLEGRPDDWPASRITMATEIDRTRRRDESPFVSWFADRWEIRRSLFNATTLDFRLFLNDRNNCPEIYRCVQGSGVLIYVRSDLLNGLS